MSIVYHYDDLNHMATHLKKLRAEIRARSLHLPPRSHESLRARGEVSGLTIAVGIIEHAKFEKGTP